MENLLNSFKLFGVSHFVYIFLAIAIIVGVYLALRKLEESKQKTPTLIIVILMSIFVLLDVLGRLIAKEDFFNSLPVAPWQVLVYISLFTEFSKQENWIKFGYFITVPVCAVQLLIVPNFYLTVGAFSVATISYFLCNALLILFALIKLTWSGEYLSKKDILNSSINYVIIVAFVHIFNVLLRFTTLSVHANYFGSMGENYDIVIGFIDKFIAIPFVNLLPLIAILVLIEFLMLLPFDIMKTKKDRKAQMEEIVALGNLKAQQQARKNKNGGSQILVRSEHKAKPSVEKKTTGYVQKDGFVSVNKTIQTNNDKK